MCCRAACFTSGRTRVDPVGLVYEKYSASALDAQTELPGHVRRAGFGFARTSDPIYGQIRDTAVFLGSIDGFLILLKRDR